MILNKFNYHAPKTITEAAKLYGELKDVRLLAGGTILLNHLKDLKSKGMKTPQNIISLAKTDGLSKIFFEDDLLTIGSMTTISAIYESALIEEHFPVLKSACRNIGTTQIRNMATLGGNLTANFTWTELGGVLIALNAKMRFLTPSDKEETISAEDFFNNNAKTKNILTTISIDKEKNQKAVYKRVSKSKDIDIPLITLCMAAKCEKKKLTDARIVLNSGRSYAKRINPLEKYCNTQSLSKQLPEDISKQLDSITLDLGSNTYKETMLKVILKEAITDLLLDG